jgi:Domain of unknown function (DUF4332)
MKIDWSTVKKSTLWSYEELIAKLQAGLSYSFVQEYYDHTLPQALDYAGRIRRGYLQDQGEMTVHVETAASGLSDLGMRWRGTYSELLCRVGTRSECVAFVEQTGLEFGRLIQLLHYLLRWVLPFQVPLREFVEVESPKAARLLTGLTEQGVKSNLDLLETGRTPAGRQALVRGATVTAHELLALVHRADISRLAYVRGRTVKHLCGGGYDTLEKIARADLAEMEARMDAYYRTLGKTTADFKAVIPLAYMIGGARTLPPIVTP